MIHGSVTDLFQDWNDCGIKYCSFKSNEHLMEGVEGNTDLDILIDPEDYDRAKSVLESHDYLRVEPVNVGTYPNVVNWYGLNYGTGRLIHIHLHFEIMTGKSLVKDYCLPWRDVFLQNIIFDTETGIKCVIPSLEYVLLSTRLVVKKSRKPSGNTIGEDTLKEFEYLKNNIEKEDLRNWANELFSDCDYEELVDLMWNVTALDSNRFQYFYGCVKKCMSCNQRMPEGIAFIRSYLNRTIRKVCRDLNRTVGFSLPLRKRFLGGGLTIAFVGIDGSGKSTVTSIISKWLSKEFDTKLYYAGAGDGKKDIISAILLKVYGKFGQKLNTDHKALADEKSKERTTLSLKQKIKGIGSSIAYIRILKSNIKHMRTARRLSKRGLICLMDRYPQNSVPFVHDGAKVKKYDTGKGILHYFAKKESRLLDSIEDNQFDLLIRMCVSGEVSFARKPLEPLENLKYKEETFNKVEYTAKEVATIDAENTLDEVVLAVKRIIWEKLSLR